MSRKLKLIIQLIALLLVIRDLHPYKSSHRPHSSATTIALLTWMLTLSVEKFSMHFEIVEVSPLATKASLSRLHKLSCTCDLAEATFVAELFLPPAYPS